MKKILMVTAVMLMATTGAQAQSSGTVSPGQLQQILQNVQQHNNGRININSNMILAALGIHQCLRETIGDEGLKRIGAMGSELNKKVKPLCAAGKRDEAMALQLEYAKKMMSSPDYAGLRSCADQYKEALNDPSLADLRAVVDNPAKTDTHVCDYQKKQTTPVANAPIKSAPIRSAPVVSAPVTTQ